MVVENLRLEVMAVQAVVLVPIILLVQVQEKFQE